MLPQAVLSTVMLPHKQWPLFQAPWHSIRVAAAAFGALNRLATGTQLSVQNSPSASLSLFCSLLVLCFRLTRALSCLFAETHRMVLLPLFLPSSASILAAGSRENIPSPVWGPLLDRIHALWAAIIGPWSGVCSCRMQKTCTKGRLVGSRLSACGDAENRPDQHSEVSSLLHGREQSRRDSEPWRARGEGGLQIRSSDTWRALGDCGSPKAKCTYM